MSRYKRTSGIEATSYFQGKTKVYFITTITASFFYLTGKIDPLDPQVQRFVFDSKGVTYIELYYGINGEQLNLEEIGSIYGITKERTRQIMESAMKKIRSHAMLIDKAICY